VLIGTKVVLNEFLTYIDLSRLHQAALGVKGQEKGRGCFF